MPSPLCVFCFSHFLFLFSLVVVTNGHRSDPVPHSDIKRILGGTLNATHVLSPLYKNDGAVPVEARAWNWSLSGGNQVHVRGGPQPPWVLFMFKTQIYSWN